MQNGFQIFNNPEFSSIRCGLIDDEIWFVAKDVADALEYARPADAITSYCKHAKLVRIKDLENSRVGKNMTLNDFKDLALPTNPYGFKIIPESDFYVLVFRSRMPKAEAFQQWVCSEVLPVLRNKGRYSIDGTYNILQEIVSVLADMKNEIAALKTARPVRVNNGIKAVYPAERNMFMDDNSKYLTVGNMCDMLQEAGYSLRFVTVIGRVLSSMSREKNYGTVHIGSVAGYHEDIWDKFFELTSSSEDFMRKYRVA